MDVVFCNAVAAARESKLMDAEKRARLTDCRDEREIMKTLAEIGFGQDAQSPEAACAQEERALADFIRAYAPSDRFAAFLLADQDFSNAEATVKAKSRGSGDVLFGPEGVFDTASMKENAAKETYNGYPAELKTAFESADAALVAGAGGVTIGAIFAKAKAAYRLRLAVGRDARAQVRYEIDTTNIQTCVRAKSFAVAQEMILPGGEVSEQRLRSVCEATPEALAAAFKMTPYQDYAQAVADALPGAFVRAERIRAERALTAIKDKRFEAEGAEPFLLYVYYKRAEIANVRIICAAIRNELDRSAIAERLRNGYGN